MPANEQTWRNIPLLHRVFAVSCLLMLVSTIWVFWYDQSREWRTTQTKVVDIDTTMIRWRQEQYATDTAIAEHETAEIDKLKVDAEFVDPAVLDQFAAEVQQFHADMEAIGDSTRVSYNPQDIAERQQDQAKLATSAAAAWEAFEQAEADADAKQAAYLEARATAKDENDPAVLAAREEAQAAQEEAAAKLAAARRASQEAARERREIVDKLNAVVIQVRNKENVALGSRKFKSADVDAAKANVDIGVRDNYSDEQMKPRKEEVDRLQKELKALNVNYEQKNETRVVLQKLVVQITARQAEAAKRFEAARAELESLQKQYAEREQSYVLFDWYPPWVYPGKRLLNLPVLNAFNPPQKIENLWSAGNLQNFNHATVRRFDRCTTCHQLLQRTIPNQPQDPAYIHEQQLVMWITPPETLALPAEEASVLKQLEKTYGLRLAAEGLVEFDDVTVSLVLPESAAAKADVQTSDGRTDPIPAEELREDVAQFTSAELEAVNHKLLPGLLVGDVIDSVNDAKVYEPETVAGALNDAVGTAKPVKLTVRRGLANPFTTHPRLDLFVGDASPHPMGTFGCTICHEGQGNATAFKWVSHTPDDSEDDPDQSIRWSRQHGWFDNHHWIYPMWPKRFSESGCLKCHHDVVELEPSEKYPDPPAAKLTHGYHLIRKYGCYGCHEVNGYDGPDKRIGPDLRTEPNFYAAALQLGELLPSRLTDLEQAVEKTKSEYEALHGNVDELSKEDQARHAQLEADVTRLERHVAGATRALELAPHVASRQHDNAARKELYQLFTNDAAIEDQQQRAFTPEIHRTAAVLKDVEVPGVLRKPGPTLRYVREKLDPVFLYDWTNNPKNFRPSTRMPRFFGLLGHLTEEPESIEKSKRLEPVEIHGIVTYLQQSSQSFVPIEKPEGIVQSTVEEKRQRGKVLFETRGCLACHEHHDFPKAKEYRGENEIVQGPELSGLAQKFDPQRNPRGREWLYSWIKNPTRYNVRTLMPNLFLDPLPVPRAMGEPPPAEGEEEYTDPAEDLVEYLLDPSHVARTHGDESTSQPVGVPPSGGAEGRPAKAGTPTVEHKPWQPAEEADQPVDPSALKELVTEYLRESFHESRLDDYYRNGLPERMRTEVKVAEQDLVVAEGETLTDQQRLVYIGRKTITKFGCYGCHDIPGFEDAKPIGTGLADWGRKDPSRLAFEHITHRLHAEHGHAEPDSGAHDESNVPTEPHERHGQETGRNHEADEMPVYYQRAIEHGNRIGFIYQKLREPRSYDFKKTENRKYNERLRMPQFPFNNEEREAVITFVIGLVAEPPTEKYVYRPDDRQKAHIAGKQVLETFNCGGCHILEGERWRLSFTPDTFSGQSPPKTFPFVLHSFDSGALAKSATPDRRGMVQAEVMGLPSLEPVGENGALPVIRDPDSADFEEGEKTTPRSAMYEFTLYGPAALGGNTYQPAARLELPGDAITRKYPTQGGYLTRYLSPVVYAMEKQVNPNAKGNEVYGWLPPPLIGEGAKVQTEWLHDFLLEPYAIRPAVLLRMPKFNMSPDDASKLTNYFATKDGAGGPYEFDRRRQSDYLASAQAQYARKAAMAGAPPQERDRFDAALKTITNRTFCVQCHSVADFRSDNTPRAQGPDLAQVYGRLRPDYLRRWLANPAMILPYTPMPENIKFDPATEQISDRWFHGTRTEHVDGLVDLLMNFDEYAKRNTRIADLVPPPPAQPPAGEAPAAETTGAEAGP